MFKKHQTENLKLKNTITTLKISIEELNSRLDEVEKDQQT